MGKLVYKTEKSGDCLNVTIEGTIDEDADFSPYSLAGNNQVNVQMDGIKGINSCGIREWIKWMSTAQGAKVTYKNCPKVIVDQINMVDGFLPQSARVESFFVPYYNDDSGEEKTVLFRNGVEFKEGQLVPPENIKDSQGNEMEMDVVEAKYFKFIKR